MFPSSSEGRKTHILWGSSGKDILSHWTARVKVKVKIFLFHLTGSRPVCSGIRPPSAMRDKIFFLFHTNYLQTLAVRLLYGALSVERRGV
jgi:hypothetical protein